MDGIRILDTFEKYDAWPFFFIGFYFLCVILCFVCIALLAKDDRPPRIESYVTYFILVLAIFGVIFNVTQINKRTYYQLEIDESVVNQQEFDSKYEIVSHKGITYIVTEREKD